MTNLVRIAPTAQRAPTQGIPIAITIMVLAILAVSTTSAFAQESEVELVPFYIHLEVTDILREHGTLFDKYMFTVDVTNQDVEILFLDLGILLFEDEFATNDCATDEWHVVNPGQTLEIVACYEGNAKHYPTAIQVHGHGESFDMDENSIHYLPFVRGECYYVRDDATCQDIQRINHLIEDVNPEPMMCEVSTAFGTPETVQPDTNTPQLLAAAYHTIFGDLVLSFNENITLADGWQDNITIGGMSIGERAKNLMDGTNSLAWISVYYTAQKDIQDMELYTVTIEPDTFLDADGNANDIIIMDPTITG